MATKKKKATKRKGSTAGTAKLKLIVAEARKIRKKNPSKKWTDCISQGSKKFKTT